jgi:hypothetical protein
VSSLSWLRRFFPLPDDDNDGIPNEIDSQADNGSNDNHIVGLKKLGP